VLHLVEGYTVIYLQPKEFANWQSESNFTNGVVQIPHCVDTFLRLFCAYLMIWTSVSWGWQNTEGTRCSSTYEARAPIDSGGGVAEHVTTYGRADPQCWLMIMCSLREEHNSHVSLVNSRLFEFQKGLEHLLIDFSVIVDSYVLDCFVNKPWFPRRVVFSLGIHIVFFFLLSY